VKYIIALIAILTCGNTTASACQCPDGVAYGGTPVTLNCGESICGLDMQTWQCSDTGWQVSFAGCTYTCDTWTATTKLDAGVAVPDSICECSGGVAYGGTPVTISCGESVCGLDMRQYSCVEGRWTITAENCGPDGGG
jgi:hypothetical protein